MIEKREGYTYHKIKKVYGNSDTNPDMLRLLLMCGKCGHVDILSSFRGEENKSQFMDGMLFGLPFEVKQFTKYFKCPKCGCSYVFPESEGQLVAEAL